MADTASVYAAHAFDDPNARCVSIDMKSNFLQPARVGDGDLVAWAEVVRAGRRIVVTRVDVCQGDRTVMTGLYTYLRTRADAGEADAGETESR